MRMRWRRQRPVLTTWSAGFWFVCFGFCLDVHVCLSLLVWRLIVLCFFSFWNMCHSMRQSQNLLILQSLLHCSYLHSKLLWTLEICQCFESPPWLDIGIDVWKPQTVRLEAMKAAGISDDCHLASGLIEHLDANRPLANELKLWWLVVHSWLFEVFLGFGTEDLVGIL